jgi:hypothetical protein
MKAKNLGLLAVALMGVSGVSLSNPITYDLSFANGSSTLTASITTDGSTGAIGSANITAWTFTDSGAGLGSFTENSTNTLFPSGCYAGPECFTARPARVQRTQRVTYFARIQ